MTILENYDELVKEKYGLTESLKGYPYWAWGFGYNSGQE